MQNKNFVVLIKFKEMHKIQCSYNYGTLKVMTQY